MTRKFIDDTTMTKITNRSDISCMQSSIDELVHRTSEIGMQVNTKDKRNVHQLDLEGSHAVSNT